MARNELASTVLFFFCGRTRRAAAYSQIDLYIGLIGRVVFLSLGLSREEDGRAETSWACHTFQIDYMDARALTRCWFIIKPCDSVCRRNIKSSDEKDSEYM